MHHWGACLCGLELHLPLALAYPGPQLLHKWSDEKEFAWDARPSPAWQIFEIEPFDTTNLLACAGGEDDVLGDGMDNIESDDLAIDGDGDDILLDSKRFDIEPRLFKDLATRTSNRGFVLVNLSFWESPASRVLPSFDEDDLVARFIENDCTTDGYKALVGDKPIKGLFMHLVPFIEERDGAPEHGKELFQGAGWK